MATQTAGHPAHHLRSADLPDPRGLLAAVWPLVERHAGLKRYVDKIRRDNLRFLVAAVAWNILISVAPIAIGMLAAANLIFRSASQRHVIVRQVSRALQGVMGPKYLEHLVNLTVQHAGLFAVFALAAVLWAAENIGFAVSQSFEAMFEVRPRNFWQEKLVHLAMLLVFVVLMFLIAAGTAALYHLPIPGALDPVLRTAFTLAAAFILFSVTYIVYPNTKKRFTLENVWRGGLLAAVLFQLLTFVWPLYEAHFSKYGGLLFPLLVLTLWIYFFSLILLIGAEVVAILTIKDAEQHGEGDGPSPDGNVPQHDSLRRQEAAKS
jgi:membrane protein